MKINVLSYLTYYPFFLGFLTYGLGISSAHFLGNKIDWPVAILGYICVILLQICSQILKLFFDTPVSLFNSETPIEIRKNKWHLLLLIGMFLTAGVNLTVTLFASGHLNLSTIAILGASFLAAFFYGVPPVRLVYTGYGELVEAIFISILTTALASLLQTGKFNLLVPMLSVPIAAQLFARNLAVSFIDLSEVVNSNKLTLLSRIGWQRTMNMHHIFLMGSFLLVLWGLVWDFPWFLAWRALLTIPIGCYQVYLLGSIAGGGKPDWPLLRLTASTTPVLTILLQLSGLWS